MTGDGVEVVRVVDPDWLDGHDAGWEVATSGRVVGHVVERVTTTVPRPPTSYIAACRVGSRPGGPACWTTDIDTVPAAVDALAAHRRARHDPGTHERPD